MSVLVMLVMFVDMLKWVEHHKKGLAVTDKMVPCHQYKAGVVSLKLDG